MARIRGTQYLSANLQDWLDGAADMGAERVSEYRLYEGFYDGEHGALLRDRARLYLHRFHVPFCENFCEPVVDVLAERLHLIGFESSEAADEMDPWAERADDWWQLNRMDAHQSATHTQALKLGDSYSIVSWDDMLKRPRFTRQRADQIKVVYSDDEPGVIEYACKTWNTTKTGPRNSEGRRIQRLNLYFPDHVEYWYRLNNAAAGGGGWAHWTDEQGVWNEPWLDKTGEPLGVPVVHFAHKPDDMGCGRSRVRQAIPFQEELNKYAADLNDLIDNHALPQDVLVGVTGDAELKRVPGDIWKVSGENASAIRLDASPTQNLLDAIEGVLSRLARRSRIPLHVLTGGTPPSGESLKTSESGLVATALEAQTVFGNSWEDLLQLSYRLDWTFGTGTQPPDDLVLEAHWKNPETRMDKDELDAALAKKALGVSQHTLIGELGYDPEKEQELRDGEAQSQMEAMAAAVDAGVPPA